MRIFAQVQAIPISTELAVSAEDGIDRMKRQCPQKSCFAQAGVLSPTQNSMALPNTMIIGECSAQTRLIQKQAFIATKQNQAPTHTRRAGREPRIHPRPALSLFAGLGPTQDAFANPAR